MENNKKKLVILISVIVVLAFLFMLAFLIGKKNGEKNNVVKTDVIPSQEEVNEPTTSTSVELSDEETATIKLIESSKVEVPGGNLVTPDNKVITNNGEQTRNNVPASDSLAPIQTGPVDKDELSAKAVNVEVSLGKFSPNEFRVKAGEPVTLSLTSNDEWVHNLVFDSNILEAVRLSVMSGETRAITFQAPNIKGEYSFKCDVGGDRIGHVVRGEFGKMIVE